MKDCFSGWIMLQENSLPKNRNECFFLKTALQHKSTTHKDVSPITYLFLSASVSLKQKERGDKKTAVSIKIIRKHVFSTLQKLSKTKIFLKRKE